MIRAAVRDLLAKNPGVDGFFRRHLWSRMHFPEAELRALHALPAGAIDVAVDVGAAMGGYAWVMGRKARRVLAYEPGRVHADYLAVAARGTNATVVRAACGSAAAELELFTPGDDNDARHMATLSRANPVTAVAGAHVERVPVVALDTDVPARVGEGARIDVLKIDVEGFENEVLAGARGLIARHKPLLIAEIEARHNPDHGAAFAMLRDLGYSVYFWRDGCYQPFDGDDIAALQTPEDLAVRLSPGHDPAQNRYINNFVFQHPQSRIKFA
jgi:FkbM family methyltransferase